MAAQLKAAPAPAIPRIALEIERVALQGHVAAADLRAADAESATGSPASLPLDERLALQRDSYAEQAAARSWQEQVTLALDRAAPPYRRAVVAQRISAEPAPQQLALALDDATTVQHADAERWRGYASLNWRKGAGDRLHQLMFPVEAMPWAIRQALRHWGDSQDLYIAQHSYRGMQRTTPHLLSLNIGHLDLDIYKSDLAHLSTAEAISAVLRALEHHQIPLPSYIVSSGRGLYLKWAFEGPLPPDALARWQAAHHYLVDLLHEFSADPKAALPTQILRIVGSTNQANRQRVDVVWVDGGDLQNAPRISFDEWASAVLPYTREQVKEFVARTRQFRDWDHENAANTALKIADQAARRGSKRSRAGLERDAIWADLGPRIGLDLAPGALSSMDDLVAGEIWQRRLRVMDQLIELRGYPCGVPAGEGQRHEWVWVAANAYGWVHRHDPPGARDAVHAWARTRIDGYSAREIDGAAASVFRRMKQTDGWSSGLYRLAETTFRERIGMTDAERDQLASLGSPSWRPADPSWQIGAMQFEPMRGLDYGAYKAETRRRQSAAGSRTSELRTAASAARRATAIEMRSAGATQAEIARQLGVNQGTVSRWLSARVSDC